LLDLFLYFIFLTVNYFSFLEIGRVGDSSFLLKGIFYFGTVLSALLHIFKKGQRCVVQKHGLSAT